MNFRIETSGNGQHRVVSLHGECDIATAPRLKDTLWPLTGPDVSTLVLDLGGLDFLDSSGLRSVMAAERMLESNERRLVLVRGTSLVQRVFELTRMTERLEFVDSLT